MGIDKAYADLQRFSDECTQCAICQTACTLFNNFGLSPIEIAQAVLHDQASDECLAAIQRCDLCGRCSSDCALGLNPASMIKAARQILIEKGRIDPQDYDVMLVDRDWNFFSIYRETYGIRFDDLQNDRFDALFFPGCTLAAYAPELTRTAFGWLQTQGLKVGFTDLCCGKPLDSIGLIQEADHHLEQLRLQLKTTGARQLITACPNCEAHLRSARLAGVEIRSIYALMVESGVRLSGSQTLTFHDSCPDRTNSQNPFDIRKLLSGFPQVEMASHGRNAICCGSGGIVSMIDPDLCAARAQRRMTEFAESRADVCVTSCMSCAHRLARASEPTRVRHCLEYVLGIQVDYAQIERNVKAMWEGSAGAINLQRLAQACLPPVKES